MPNKLAVKPTVVYSRGGSKNSIPFEIKNAKYFDTYLYKEGVGRFGKKVYKLTTNYFIIKLNDQLTKHN
jgi:hypothetical protein